MEDSADAGFAELPAKTRAPDVSEQGLWTGVHAGFDEDHAGVDLGGLAPGALQAGRVTDESRLIARPTASLALPTP